MLVSLTFSIRINGYYSFLIWSWELTNYQHKYKRKIIKGKSVQIQVLVDGFKQTATVSRILERLTLEFQLTVNTRKLTVEKYAEHVKKAIDEKIGLKFFLIINSMDAQNLR